MKGYVCIFICLTTKAVHVELVMDLSTDSFVAALKRFVSRRGQPAVIMTDNGTNFVSARCQLEEAYQWLTRQETRETLSQYLFERKIQWLHTPARSPHFGGIWEAGVKQMKILLHKTLGTQRLTCEEMYAVLTEVEAVLNSRPLTPLDSAPLDGASVLTPGHFLIGRSLKALPEVPNTSTPSRGGTSAKLLRSSCGSSGVRITCGSCNSSTDGNIPSVLSKSGTLSC